MFKTGFQLSGRILNKKTLGPIPLVHLITHSKPRTGFVRVLENLESPGILLWHFPGLESPGKGPLVLESSGNLLNSAKKI